MRHLLPLALAVLGSAADSKVFIPIAPAPRPAADGETLLRETDAKIAAAKSLRVDFEIRVRVWIDSKTGLPLRRSMTMHGTTYNAVHSKFEIDPKLDDKLFEIPK